MVSLTGALLQLYLFLYGCSAPANLSSSPEQALYSAKCGSCHRLLPPPDYTLAVWQDYVDKYGKKMTDLEKQQVLNYLQQDAKTAASD